jgi:hypothetical protein
MPSPRITAIVWVIGFSFFLRCGAPSGCLAVRNYARCRFRGRCATVWMRAETHHGTALDFSLDFIHPAAHISATTASPA